MNNKIKYFLPKVFNRLAHEKNRIWEYLPVEKISLWGMGGMSSKGELIQRLQEMLGEFTPEFFAEIDSEDKETIIMCADSALNHDFDLLGSEPVHLDPISWHSDFKSGYTWPKGVFYRKIPKNPSGTDIKVPWELSRCHHLLWSGEAYLITKDEKYAQEIVAEIDNWIDENPLMYSVNWTCAMDIAIRAINWMYALNFILASRSFTDEFASRVSKSLFQHAFFIKNNLEKVIPFSNNHYSTDIVGLLYLGLLFNKTLKGRYWLRFAQKEFYKDIEIQILPSGIHYEKSVSYHRLMVELYSYPIYMFDRCGIKVPNTVRGKVQRMFDYVENYTKPNGIAPLIADNDDGRFLPIVRRDFREHRYLNDSSSVESAVAANGIKQTFNSMASGSRLYDDAGVAIVRSKDAFLLVSCVGYSKKPKPSDINLGTHTHNDLLSFELNVGGNDIIIDPGTYLYTSSIKNRNEFRSTLKHNTIIVDGEEQNILSETNAFSLKRNVAFDKLSMGGSIVNGNYHTLSGQMSHHRTFDLQEGKLLIKDIAEKTGSGHEGHLRLHLAEGIEPELKGDFVIFEVGNYEFSISNSECETSIENDTWSPSFGVLKNNKTIDLKFKFDNNIKLSTIISWTKTNITK